MSDRSLDDLPETATCADLPDTMPVWVATNRSGSSDIHVHLSPECRHLRAAGSVHEKRPPMYYDDTAVCQSCLGNPPSGGSKQDLAVFEAARNAGDADD